MMEQRLANFVCRLEAPRAGTAMGTAEAPRLFVMCFADGLKEWN